MWLSRTVARTASTEFRLSTLASTKRLTRATRSPSTLWDPDLVHEVASAISDEARGFSARDGKGLTYWAPVINMLRDPRWGRFEESYSEDPWLMARMGVAFVCGMQGDDPRYLKTVATPKHYAGNNSESAWMSRTQAHGRATKSFSFMCTMLRQAYRGRSSSCAASGAYTSNQDRKRPSRLRLARAIWRFGT